MRKQEFIKQYSAHVQQGSAGLFLGAGLSIRAGYPSWRTLVQEMAAEIGLDAERETDLASVVQYFLNKSGKTRTRLARIIHEQFGPENAIPPIFRVLARLPLRRIWTTNYDTLIERAWRDARKLIDSKSRDKEIPIEKTDAHAILYKMHGTVDLPSEVVLAKSDYESFRRTRGGFLHLLTGHLVSQHILFIGFSFTDPNLSHLFTIIREAFDDTPPEHFAIVRKPQSTDFSSQDMFNYSRTRHDLWVSDLQNYGIQSVEVDSFEEIDELVEAIERRIAMSNVLVSGSYPTAKNAKELKQGKIIESVSQAVGEEIALRGLRLVSGLGLTVGNATLSGAFHQINKRETPNFENSLLLRPFPQIVPRGVPREEFYRSYRTDFVSQAGVCVFIAGVKQTAKQKIVAPGVLQEFEVMRTAKRYPIPIGATGGAAEQIWKVVATDYKTFLGKMPKKLFNSLNDRTLKPKELANAVGDILDWLQDNDPND